MPSLTRPFAPMLARLARELPRDPGFLYEPKWDGFRCIAFRERADIDLRSRNGRPFARYFPEIVDGLRRVSRDHFIMDGELLVIGPRGFDFAALMARLHPAASRVERLRTETPASFVAFDLIALDDADLTDVPFAERRQELEEVLRERHPPILLSPITQDVELASQWLEAFNGAGLDGVVAKHRDLRYEPDRRLMVKVKRERTADCVVAGFRLLTGEPVVGSLLLGLYDGSRMLRHIGVTSSFTAARRRELIEQLRPLVVPLEGHPWEAGFGLERSPVGRLGGAASRWTPELEADWIPLVPELVCEVAYDQWDGDRFRHPARFQRWRPDRDATSCGFDQLELPATTALNEILRRA